MIWGLSLFHYFKCLYPMNFWQNVLSTLVFSSGIVICLLCAQDIRDRGKEPRLAIMYMNNNINISSEERRWFTWIIYPFIDEEIICGLWPFGRKIISSLTEFGLSLLHQVVYPTLTDKTTWTRRRSRRKIETGNINRETSQVSSLHFSGLRSERIGIFLLISL